MKMRKKGKVHPFNSSSSSSNQNRDALSVLKLLPAAIFALVSVLSLEDREVLAYMMTRSLKSANPSVFPAEENRRSSGKHSFDGHGHKAPAMFDCDCFHCYTNFWFKWDSSPNRVLIQEAIESFEEHLNNGERLKNSGGGKNKRKEKMGRRRNERTASGDGGGGLQCAVVENQEVIGSVLPENEVAAEAEEIGVDDDLGLEIVAAEAEALLEDDVAPPRSAAVQCHRGLARKVLPDLMGIFNSRLWSLWGPNV